MVSPNADNISDEEIQITAKQIKNLSIFQVLAVLILLGLFVADVCGQIPDSTATTLFKGGMIGAGIVSYALLKARKQQLQAKLVSLRTKLVSPIAAPK